jgi:simple sugar transport system permease protein
LLGAIAIGLLAGMLLALFTVTLAVDQIIPGIAINIMAAGLTSYLSRVLITGDILPYSTTFSEIHIPILSDLPVVGTVLFSHTWLVYAAVFIVVFIAWLFKRTTIGLNLRAIGEDPRACETVGININKYRFLATTCSGVLASVGGAFITLVSVNRFLENIVDGRGWMAMAAIIFGKYTPWGVYGACFLFGAAEALQMMLQVQGIGLNYRLVLMIPYVLTIVALAGIVGKVVAPAAHGIPYIKE